MTSKAAPGPLEVVVLTEEEVVLRGGVATTSWLVPYNDATVRAQRHPSARPEQLDRGPGIVWRTRITLELPREAWVTRVDRRPDTRARSALEHLTLGSRGAQLRETRTRFKIGAGGELHPEPPPGPPGPK